MIPALQGRSRCTPQDLRCLFEQVCGGLWLGPRYRRRSRPAS